MAVGGGTGGGRGGRGGGGYREPPDWGPTLGLPEGRGPDFFEQRDMDVPQQTLLYDPYEEMIGPAAARGARSAGRAGPGPGPRSGSPAGTDKSELPGDMLAQAKADPDPDKPPPKGGRRST